MTAAELIGSILLKGVMTSALIPKWQEGPSVQIIGLQIKSQIPCLSGPWGI